MSKKQSSDEAMDAEPTTPVEDEALADEAAPDEPELEPDEFDLLAWLGGIGPVVAEYPLPGGGRLPMQARTNDWREQWAKDADERDLPTDERDRIFVAAHIADERVTPDSLTGLQEHAPADWAEIVALAIHLDTRPRNQLAPRFLPGASG